MESFKKSYIPYILGEVLPPPSQLVRHCLDIILNLTIPRGITIINFLVFLLLYCYMLSVKKDM